VTSDADTPQRPGPAVVNLAPGVDVPASAIKLTFVRSDGPGGQNVNKRSTRAQLRVAIEQLPLDPKARERLRRIAGSLRTTGDELLISDGRRRSQQQNAQACFDRLARLIESARRAPTLRRATKPTRSSVRKRLDAKTQRGAIKRQRRDPED